MKTGGGACFDSKIVIEIKSARLATARARHTPSQAAASVLGRELTTVSFIAHVSAVGPVVTQVFHQDAGSIATTVLIRHAGSDDGYD